jgi:hypothetical protein
MTPIEPDGARCAVLTIGGSATQVMLEKCKRL